MKNNRAINIAFIIFVFGLFIISYSPLASIKNNTAYKESSKAKVYFKGNKDEKVNFNYESSIKEGTLKLQLIDENGNVVENFDPNKKDSESISLESTGEYMIMAIYDNFIGDYKISASR